jgi:D-glycero-D-manno-heptose 1,7-bisphosphate phosphatase
MNKAIFLDRDGTIIEEKGYICKLSESEIFPFAFDAVKRMNAQGFKVIVVTNQSSIARGICKKEDVEKMHADIQYEFEKNNAHIHRFYYCPYHKNGIIEEFKIEHPWRKPEPGMLLQAAKDFNLDLSASYMIGDDTIDIFAGINAGSKTTLILTGKGKETKKKLQDLNIKPDFISENILDFSYFIK